LEDEQPVEKRIAEEGNVIYGVLTHACPLKYIPNEVFLSVTSNKSSKNKSKRSKNKKHLSPTLIEAQRNGSVKLKKILHMKSGNKSLAKK